MTSFDIDIPQLTKEGIDMNYNVFNGVKELVCTSILE